MNAQQFYIRFKLNDFDANYLYYSSIFQNYDFGNLNLQDTEKVFLFTLPQLEELGIVNNPVFDIYEYNAVY